MREVIQDLLAAETEAREIVRLAREEAERIAAEADKRARAFLTKARTETRAHVERLMATAIEDAEALKRRQLQKAATDGESRIRLDPEQSEAIVHALASFLCGCSAENASQGRPSETLTGADIER